MFWSMLYYVTYIVFCNMPYCVIESYDEHSYYENIEKPPMKSQVMNELNETILTKGGKDPHCLPL
jgi:hypothetical protein